MMTDRDLLAYLRGLMGKEIELPATPKESLVLAKLGLDNAVMTSAPTAAKFALEAIRELVNRAEFS